MGSRRDRPNQHLVREQYQMLKGIPSENESKGVAPLPGVLPIEPMGTSFWKIKGEAYSQELHISRYYNPSEISLVYDRNHSSRSRHRLSSSKNSIYRAITTAGPAQDQSAYDSFSAESHSGRLLSLGDKGEYSSSLQHPPAQKKGKAVPSHKAGPSQLTLDLQLNSLSQLDEYRRINQELNKLSQKKQSQNELLVLQIQELQQELQDRETLIEDQDNNTQEVAIQYARQVQALQAQLADLENTCQQQSDKILFYQQMQGELQAQLEKNKDPEIQGLQQKIQEQSTVERIQTNKIMEQEERIQALQEQIRQLTIDHQHEQTMLQNQLEDMGRNYGTKLAELEQELVNQGEEQPAQESQEVVQGLSVVHESLKESVFSFNPADEKEQDLQARVEAQQAEITRLTRCLDDRPSELQALQSQNQSLNERLAQKEKQNNVFIQEFSKKVGQKDTMIEELQQKVVLAQAEKHVALQQNMVMQQDMERIKEALEQSQAQVETLQTKLCSQDTMIQQMAQAPSLEQSCQTFLIQVDQGQQTDEQPSFLQDRVRQLEEERHHHLQQISELMHGECRVLRSQEMPSQQSIQHHHPSALPSPRHLMVSSLHRHKQRPGFTSWKNQLHTNSSLKEI